MNQLQKGSRGDEVKALQEMLRKAGFFTYPTNTGYFGDITEKALRDFQQSRGLKVDGIYGARTAPALQATERLNAIQSNPNIPQEVKQILDPKNGDARVFEPYNATLSEADYGAIRQRAERELAPFYQAQQNYETQDYQSNLDNQNTQYSEDTNALKNQAIDAANDLDNAEGVKGTWASSARNARRNSLQNQYNSKFSSLYNQAQKNLSTLRNDFAYKYGDSAIKNNTPITRFNTNLANRSFTADATGGQYNPFGFEGTRNLEKATSATNYANNFINSTRRITQ